MSNKNTERGNSPADDDRPITKLHIPYDMVIDPDRPKKIDREPPPLYKTVYWGCVILALVALLAGLLFLIQARPIGSNFFSEVQGLVSSSTWNALYLTISVCCLSVCVAVSAVEAAYMFASRRKVAVPLIISLVLAAALLILRFSR